MANASAIRLDTLPPEILVRIGDFLAAGDALVFCRSNRTVWEAISRDVVKPIRLATRIAWVGGLSSLNAAIADTLAAPKGRRPALFELLEWRSRALHPNLQEPARQALAPHRVSPPKLWFEQLYTCAGAMPPLGGMPVSREELLERLLQSPPDIRARLLPRFIGHRWAASGDKQAPRPDDWRRILAACRPGARGPVLAAMASELHIETYDEEQAIVLSAIRNLARPDGSLPAEVALALAGLARRLVNDAPDWEPVRIGQSFDEILALAQRLPVSTQGSVLAALSECIHHDQPPPAENEAASPAPRWYAFIAYVRSTLPPDEVATVLGTLCEHNGETEDEELERPVREALLAAAQGLPHAPWARLLGVILNQHTRETQEFADLWQATLEATELVGSEDAVPLYEALATSLLSLPDDRQSACGQAIAVKLQAVSEPRALRPALHVFTYFDSARALDWRAMLFETGKKLPTPDRAILSSWMTVMHALPPALWRAQVLELDALPRQARFEAARKLVRELVRLGDDMFLPQTEAEAEADLPDPSDPPCARVPRTPRERLSCASDILSMLTLADRGSLLLSLSPMRNSSTMALLPWSRHRASWVLEEALKLAPLRHHAIGAVSAACMAIAQQCPSEAEARWLLPAMMNAVRALPAANRASALLFVGSLLQRLAGDANTMTAWSAELSALPPEDVAAAFPRKRKEAPA
ncbi:hypothetical protein [Paracidovorax citrulli]